jgi:hypothetical protein
MAKRPPKPAGSFVARWAGKFTVRPAVSPDPRREALLRKHGLKLPAK